MVNLSFGRGSQFAKVKVLANPAVTVVIPGTDRPNFAVDNLNAARGRIQDAKMREAMVKYWDGLG